jgi:hypothetical protein
MAHASSETDPIAVIGAGHAASAALVRALLGIDATRPDGAPPITVWLLETREAKPPDDTPYPLGGRSAADLHPFDGPEPAQGFPYFGEYVRQKLPEQRGLRNALSAPTYGQIDGYVKYLVELAGVIAGDRARVEVDRTRVVERIDQNPRSRSGETMFLPATNGVIAIDRAVFERLGRKSGPVTITFTDGTSLGAAELILAKHPPHMADLLQHLGVITRASL